MVPDRVLRAEFSPGGTKILTLSPSPAGFSLQKRGTLRIWDTDTRKLLLEQPQISKDLDRDLDLLLFSPDDSKFVDLNDGDVLPACWVDLPPGVRGFGARPCSPTPLTFHQRVRQPGPSCWVWRDRPRLGLVKEQSRRTARSGSTRRCALARAGPRGWSSGSAPTIPPRCGGGRRSPAPPPGTS